MKWLSWVSAAISGTATLVCLYAFTVAAGWNALLSLVLGMLCAVLTDANVRMARRG